MERKSVINLTNWKLSASRMPLLVTGARQIGKTHSILDFVIQDKDGKIIPVEVKSSENVKAKSLKVFCERYKPEMIYRISTKNFGLENGIKSIPLYAVFCIQ